MNKNDIIQKCSKENTTYSPGRKLDFIVAHYTAGASSKKGSARNTAAWFANPLAQASADFIVDDVEIVQFNGDIPNRYCWSVGGGHYGNKGGRLYGVAKNSNTISIEICSSNDTGKMTNANDSHYYFTDAVLERAKELIVYLMDKYKISADHVIRHYDVNGKPCPGIKGWNAESGDEKKWKAFHASLTGAKTSESAEKKYYRVRLSWEDTKSQIGAYTSLDNAKKKCPDGYTVYDWNGKAVYSAPSKGFQAKSLEGLTDSEKIKKIAPLYQAVMKKTGMLASVAIAQFCLESGFGTSDLAKKANNLHGMKKSLSGNTWSGSTWDGISTYGKNSPEERNGVITNVYSEFRKYPNCEDSIADRAAYFIGAMKGSEHRYPGINKITDWKKQVEAIKAGGYATDSSYVSKLTEIINRYKLYDYDNVKVSANTSSAETSKDSEKTWYRVRKTWNDSKSQKGAFHNLSEAKKCADANTGYSVYDENGKAIYTGKNSQDVPFSVKVEITDLNIRTGAGTGYKAVRNIPVGKYTITEVKSGKGSTAGWGRLKSGEGWISLDFVKRI